MIKPYNDEFTVDYSNERLKDVFVLSGSSEQTKNSYTDDTFQVGGAEEWLSIVEDSVITESLLLATDIIETSEAIAVLKKLADEGIHIFLLLDETVRNNEVIELLSGCCCIRTGPKQSGMIVIADHHLEFGWARIFSAGFIDNQTYGYSLTLESKQIEQYFQLFCFLFWKKSDHEYLEQGVRQVCGQAPVANISLSHRHIFPENLVRNLSRSMDEQGSLLSNTMEGSGKNLLQMFNPEAMNLSMTNLILSLKQVNSDTLATLIEHSGSIDLIDEPWLPQLLVANGESWLLPLQCQKEAIAWAVQLTDNQKYSVENYRFELASGKRWTLKKDLQVSDIASPIRFAQSIDSTDECLPKTSLSLGSIEADNYHEFEQETAENIAAKNKLTDFSRHPLACEISFSITVNPPWLPKNASVDKLHVEWGGIEKDWSDQVNRLSSKHNQIQQGQQSIADNIRRFMGGFLTGQLNSFRKTEKVLQELALVSLSQLSPSRRSEKLQKINELSEQLLKTAEKLADETDVAGQLKEWEEKEQNLQKQLDTAFSKQKNTDKSWQAFEDQKQPKISSIENAFRTQWQDWLGGFDGDEEVESLLILNADEIVNWIEDAKEKLAVLISPTDDANHNQELQKEWSEFLTKHAENEAIQVEIEELKQLDSAAIREWLKKPTIKLSKSIKKNLQALKSGEQKRITSQNQKLQEQRSKANASLRKILESYQLQIKALTRDEQTLNGQQKEAQRNWERLAEEVSRHEQAKHTIKPKDSKGALATMFGTGAKSSNQYFHISFPAEDLPKVGQLYQSGGQRYLAIREKTDVETGKQDAERLHADLVVLREK